MIESKKEGIMKKIEGLRGPFDISTEEWREYDNEERVYRIYNPRWLYLGDTTHRVIDSQSVTHCVVGPGGKVVLRWYASLEPVSF